MNSSNWLARQVGAALRPGVLMACLALVACAKTSAPTTMPPPPPPVAASGEETKLGPWPARPDGTVDISASERARCTALRGTITQTGFSTHACTYPAPDAGKACTGSDQCVGKCLALQDDAEAGAAAAGACSALVNRGGCANFIENGKASGMLCVD